MSSSPGTRRTFTSSRHGLHYGTGRLRGNPLLRHRDRSRDLPPPGPPRPARQVRRALLPAASTTRSRRSVRRTKELIRRNGLRSCYIRPIAFRGYGEMGLYAQSAPVDVFIAVWPWGAYLGEEGKQKGVRAKVSSWRRISPAGLIPHAKASGQYLNSILAKTESANAGYDEAILLDERGFVCEGSGREHLPRPRGRDRDPRPHLVDPRRHQSQVGDPDRTRPRLHRGRARHRARRALPRRGGLPDRHGRRARPGARDRRPRPRWAGRDHPGDPEQVRRRALRAARGVPRVARPGWRADRRGPREPTPAEVDAEEVGEPASGTLGS